MVAAMDSAKANARISSPFIRLSPFLNQTGNKNGQNNKRNF